MVSFCKLDLENKKSLVENRDINMKMIALAMCIVLRCHYSCVADGNPKDSVVYIDVHKVNLTSMTPFSVDCNRFETAFTDIDSFRITDPNQIGNILNSISAAITMPEVKSVDTRAKIFLHYSTGKVDSLCADGSGGYILNGVVKYLSDDNVYFLRCLKRLTKVEPSIHQR